LACPLRVAGRDRPAQIAQEPARRLIVRDAVRHEQVLVPAVKADELCGGEIVSRAETALPVPVGENPGHEVFPQHWIVQPAVLLRRQVGQRGGNRRSVSAAAPGIGRARHLAVGDRVNLDPEQAAAGRVLHENVTADVRQRRRRLPTEFNEPLGDVHRRVFHPHDPRIVRLANEPDRLPRRAHADAHLRTDSPIREQTVEQRVRERRS
jgi:hypothetical protein